MAIGYVLAMFPKVSETFISGEVAELVRQGEDVQVFSLRRPLVPGPVHPGTEELLARTTYVPGGALGALALLGALLWSAVAHPVRTTRAGGIALTWAIRHRRLSELVRLAQVAWLRRRAAVTCTHLHAHFAHGPASAAMLLSTLTGLPFTFTGHARDLFEHGNGATLREKTAAATAVVAISEHGLQHIQEVVGPELAGKVQLVRNGIDLERFCPRPEPPAGPPVVLAVSRMVAKKGLDVLIWALPAVRREIPDVTCEIIGDGPLRPELETLVRSLRLEDVVQMAGSVDSDGVLAAYRRATVFALPCRVDPAGDQDGLPVSVVEAMAVGVPVVSTPVAGVPEVVVDGWSGLLVRPDDAEALAAALVRVLTDDRLADEVVRGGHEVADSYNRPDWVARLRTVMLGHRPEPLDVSHPRRPQASAGGTR